MKLAINANVFTVIILLLCGFIGFFWRNHWAALVFDHLDWFAADVQKIHAHQPVPLRKGEPLILLEYFSTEGKLQSTKLFLSETGLLGLVVLNNGQLVYERYKPGKNHRDLFYSWSMAKSIASVLVGFAIEEGYIHSVKDPVSVYLPEFSDHLFGQASVEDLLTMSSGVDFNENYSDPKSDVLQLFLSIKNDQSSFLKTLSRQPLNSLNEPFLAGQYNQYVSSDTQVLTMILQRVLPMPISKYLELKLWKPTGMESPAYWLADKTGMVASFCCLKTSTRDMARLGLIMLQHGIYQGTSIIPANWINQSLDTTPIRLQAGKQPWSRSTWAYGYQWWMPPSIDKTNQMLMNDFLAVGVFYQFFLFHQNIILS